MGCRPLLCLLTVVCAAALAACDHTAGAGGEPPEGIVLVTIDTLRADHLPVYGYPRAITPFLSELVAEGLVFERATASSSHTAPSHASLFTGLHPPQHGVLRNGQHLREGISTVAGALAREGRKTAGVSTGRFLSGVAQGFDRFSAPDKVGVYRPADSIVDRGLEWLRSLEPRTPFLLWLHFFDVHEWYRPERRDEGAGEALERVAGLHGADLVDYLVREQGDPLQHLDSPEELLRMVDHYDGQILAVDQALHRFAEELEGMGLASRTVWIVTSDHGEGLGNHGRKGHGAAVYNELIQVPLVLFAGDGRWRSGRSGRLVELVDLAQTLVELGGGFFADGRNDRLGRSLAPLLAGGNDDWSEDFAFGVRRPAAPRDVRRGWSPGDVYAFQEGSIKVIVDTEGRTELYDLASDPYEERPIHRRRPGLLRRLEGRATTLFKYLESTGTGTADNEVRPEHVEELRALGYL